MMTALATAPFPLEPTCTDRGVADSTVMPARYWPGAVLAGTCTVNDSRSPMSAGSVTRPGSPLTQQPEPEHPPNDGSKSLPPWPAVTPTDRPILSVTAVVPGLLTIAVSTADRPGATAMVKYGGEIPLLPGTGVMPNWPLPTAGAAAAGHAGMRTASTARATAPVRLRHRPGGRRGPVMGRIPRGASPSRDRCPGGDSLASSSTIRSGSLRRCRRE